MADQVQNMLFKLACQFRLAILASQPSKSSLATLRDFPHGACGDASLLLSKYLQVKRCGLSFYVLGKRDDHPHVWLRLHDFIIDITADQFDDQQAGVIVASESSWHSSFNGEIHNLADFCLYDRHTVHELTRAYEAITRCLS